MATLPQRSAAQLPLLTQRADGAWEFTGETEDEHVDTFLKVDSNLDSSQWALAAIAASLEKRHGEGTVEEFAKKVKHTPRHIRRIAKTYKETVQKGRYRPNLTFSHHVEALSYKGGVDAALDAAEAHEFSALGLRDWITQKAREERAERGDTELENSFQAFLETVEAVITDDWLVNCPDKQWARRTFQPVLEEVRDANKQIYLSDISAKVKVAIKNGAGTVEDIKIVTGLKAKEVEQVVNAMVQDGEYEWVREGGETEVARGTRRNILHRVGEPVFV